MASAYKIDWKTDTLPRKTLKALNLLSKKSWLKRSLWYLAGGTAFALHVGHRQSQDLDFFYPEKDFSLQSLVARFDKSEWETDILKEGTVYGNLCGAKISFIAYPFFKPKDNPNWYENIRILTLWDIAVMKMIAISQRGRKRDFIDLYWYLTNGGNLLNLLLSLSEQYPHINHNYHHMVESLTYFEDAESDPMPRLFFKTSWRQVKSYFRKNVPEITRKFLGLKKK